MPTPFADGLSQREGQFPRVGGRIWTDQGRRMGVFWS